tara:strand:+ start:234 stop:1100 length:867 start_codon:yes stop_codon:yes gene_type:complete
MPNVEQVPDPQETREEFCKFEKQAMEGWKAVSEYVEALHFLYFYSADNLADFGFASKADALTWIKLSTKKMYLLLEALEPHKPIVTKTRGTYQWSPFGTRSNIYVMHLLPRQYEEGIDHTKVSTAVHERMQKIPRNAAKTNSFRGTGSNGKSQPQTILEAFDTKAFIGRQTPKHASRAAKRNAKTVAKRVSLLQPKNRMKQNVDAWNQKTVVDILGADWTPPTGRVEDAERAGVAEELEVDALFAANMENGDAAGLDLGGPQQADDEVDDDEVVDPQQAETWEDATEE